MTPDELAEIRAREQVATPGPWRTHDTYVPAGGYCMTVLSGDGNDVEPRAWLPTFSNDTGSPMARNVEADAEFMACAREDVPALLARVTDLEAQLEEITDLDRSALKHQELRDDRARAVRMWHDEKKRADTAEARVAELEAELTAMHDEAGHATARIRELDVELGTEVQWGVRVHIVDELGDRGSHVLTGYTEDGARYRAYAVFEHAEPVFRRLGEWQPAPNIAEASDA